MLDRNHLAQPLGILGRHFDGEVINAGRFAVRLVKDGGPTWQQMVDHDVAIQSARQLLAENERLCADDQICLKIARIARARGVAA